MDLQKLKEPFPAKEIKWRVGATTKDKKKGIALAYIDSRAVMDRLDEVCGVENWQNEYEFGDNGEIICRIGIRIGEQWVWKSDGAGQTDFEAEKGGLSDAFKRAGVKWGIGRYLYHLDANWVPIKKRGKSYVIKNPPSLPEWALPEGEESEEDLGKKFNEYEKKQNLQKIRKLYQSNTDKAEPILMEYLDSKGYQDLSEIAELDNSELEELNQKLKGVA